MHAPWKIYSPIRYEYTLRSLIPASHSKPCLCGLFSERLGCLSRKHCVQHGAVGFEQRELRRPHVLTHLRPTPLSPPPSRSPRFVYWVLSFTIPGLGMFSEAYFVFSVGNLKPIFKVTGVGERGGVTW